MADVKSDVERLDSEVFGAVRSLARVIGIPDTAPGGGRSAPAGWEMVDEEQVPAMALQLARLAMDVLLVASGMLEEVLSGEVPEGTSVEEGLRLLTALRPLEDGDEGGR